MHVSLYVYVHFVSLFLSCSLSQMSRFFPCHPVQGCLLCCDITLVAGSAYNTNPPPLSPLWFGFIVVIGIISFSFCLGFKADFILVCLSPQYVREIQMVSKASDANSQTWQHAAHIYHLMQQEYERTRRTSRFVPLFFEGLKLEGTPSWLTHHLVYHWPQQYKDLLWMLTKPEERIKPRSKAEKNCSMLKNGHCMPVLSSSGY